MAFSSPFMLLMFACLFLLLRRSKGFDNTELSGIKDYVEKARAALGRWTIGEVNTTVAFGAAIFLWVLPSVSEIALGKDAGLSKLLTERLNEGVVALIAACVLFILPVSLRKMEFTMTWKRAVRIGWGTIILFGGGLSLGGPGGDGSRAFMYYLVLTAVVCGALVMVVEVLGSRVLGPFFGVSLFVWTSLITVTLVALAAGYAAGGILSDRRRDPDFKLRHFMQPCRAIIDAELYKLLEWLDGSLALYNLKQDFWEDTDLADRPELQPRLPALKEKLCELSDQQAFSDLKERLGEFTG